MLPCPTVDHLSESGFPRLPRGIKKTSDLIENPVEVRDFLSRLAQSQVRCISIPVFLFFINLLFTFLLGQICPHWWLDREDWLEEMAVT